MEIIHRGNGFAIVEKDGVYQISWAQGPYNEPVFYPISKQNMDKAFKSDQDAHEVMIYAETGQWPIGAEEEVKGMPKDDMQDRLLIQVRKVLALLREQYTTKPTPMLEMIITRYQHAKDILENSNINDLKEDTFRISGSVRIYLESSSDYMNPVLGEMDKAENMLKDIFG